MRSTWHLPVPTVLLAVSLGISCRPDAELPAGNETTTGLGTSTGGPQQTDSVGSGPTDTTNDGDTSGTLDESDGTGTVPACLPGDKPRFVFTIGSLDEATATNWVRIGTYTFECTGETSGTVRSDHWRFNQTSRRALRETTETQADQCIADLESCPIRTAGDFGSAASPPEQWEGTYSVTGDQLRIAWNDTQAERWTVSLAADAKLARLDFTSQDAIMPPPTHGWAYGSTAAYETTVPVASIGADFMEDSLEFEYAIWNNGSIATDDVPFALSGWGQCLADAIGKTGCRTLAAGGGGCIEPVDPHHCDPGQSPMMYYLGELAFADRRNVYEFWTQCLAEGRDELCYTGNSHVRPMLQIIDDDGAWHGWIGIEASSADVASGDYIGVFRKAGV